MYISAETQDRLYSGRVCALYFLDIDLDFNVGGAVVRIKVKERGRGRLEARESIWSWCVWYVQCDLLLFDASRPFWDSHSTPCPDWLSRQPGGSYSVHHDTTWSLLKIVLIAWIFYLECLMSLNTAVTQPVFSQVFLGCSEDWNKRSSQQSTVMLLYIRVGSRTLAIKTIKAV